MRKLESKFPINERLPYNSLLTALTFEKTIIKGKSKGTKGYCFQLVNYGANNLSYQTMRQEFIREVSNSDQLNTLEQAQKHTESQLIDYELFPYFIIICQGAITYTPVGSTSSNAVKYYMQDKLYELITSLCMTWSEKAGREFISVDNNNLPMFLNILTIFLYINEGTKKELLGLGNIEDCFNYVNYGIMNLLINCADQLENDPIIAQNFYTIYDTICMDFMEPD